jgi:hypothetical protein
LLNHCCCGEATCILYAFFWVIPRHLKFICRCFGNFRCRGITQKKIKQHSEHGKSLKSTICISYSICMFVTFVIKHAKCMPHIILTSVACLALQYFSALSHKRNDFWKKFIEYKMCVLIFCTNFVWNISNSKNNSASYDHTCTYIFT